ncbi:uncharacterized protein BP5553_00984 [Venustampulla echinocandica]|uniref:Uncharacterized protein n=1 Tax=Venustampulla echinocandica TaxID=2656787 RepID=A0A370TZQ8_9HELO|nr:uncharacterized protein BP5553_00984 [Venustampulla echinocandica]RDL41005.1 hypothetical protein BP5553_00984 [Venustampulla echinocandica]
MGVGIDVSDENIHGRFDKLAKIGIIKYGPSTVIPIVDRNFPLEFRIYPTSSQKPLTVNDSVASHSHLDDGEPEKLGPGSDIYRSHPDQILGIINGTHILALNIYPVFRPQYLLLTCDSYRLQDEPLDLHDIKAVWEFLNVTTETYYAMYNCAEQSGCSRKHKHMQILPKPEAINPDAEAFRFFPDVRDRQIQVPYVYFLHYFYPLRKGQPMDSEAVFATYSNLLRQYRTMLGIAEHATCAHNVLLTKEWIIVIPRRKGNYKGIMANATAMMGQPTVSSQELFKIWTDEGPVKCLGEFGISNTSL